MNCFTRPRAACHWDSQASDWPTISPRLHKRRSPEVERLTIRIPIRLQRRGSRKLIMTPQGAAIPTSKPGRDETLIKALVRAHRWRRRIESGQARSMTDLAEHERVTVAFVCRLLPLTCLAPDIVEAILDGRQPKGLRLAEMLGSRATAWSEQRTSLGFNSTALFVDRSPTMR